MSTLEQAEATLSDRQAAAAEAQRILDEASAAIETASNEVESTTTKIEAASDLEIPALAAARAVAQAKVEAFTARAKAKVQPLMDAQGAVRDAETALARVAVAAEAKTVLELDTALAEKIASAAGEWDEKRLEIAAHLEAGHRAGRRSGLDGYRLLTTFGSSEAIVAALTKALAALSHEAAMVERARLQRLEAEAREAVFWRQRELAAAAPEPVVTLSIPHSLTSETADACANDL